MSQSERTSMRQGCLLMIAAAIFLFTAAPGMGMTHPRQAQDQAPSGPQAVFPERVHDAGTVEAGVDITHAFKVKNAGKTDLLIEQVNPG
jgi:hypothetical protein